MQECREKRNMCKGSKMEKRENATNKQKKWIALCKLANKGKNAKRVKQKNYDLQNRKRVSQTRTSKYKSIRNFQVEEQSGAQVRLEP
jgi:V8-like Glu-specific endopeptidase